PSAISCLTAGPSSERWAVANLDAESRMGLPQARPDGIYRCTGADWSLAIQGAELRTAGLPASALVRVVAQTAGGQLWIGTSAGLWRFDPAAAALEPSDPVVASAPVRALLVLPPTLETLCVGSTHGLFVGLPGTLAPVAALERYTVNVLAWD